VVQKNADFDQVLTAFSERIHAGRSAVFVQCEGGFSIELSVQAINFSSLSLSLAFFGYN
jgi:hypothetical protein